MKNRFFILAGGAFVVCLGLALPLPRAYGEAMIQYFNTSWKELTYKMPELAEVGYDSIWLPPPQKGSGGLSVGYDHWDPFDFGQIDQRGTVRTRYGTEAELLHLIEVAHRFGLRVYFDNIMNHRAFDVPGFNESTALDVYPGLYPEDFHLRVTEEGFYRKWDNVRDWQDAWQVVNMNFSDLIDIAQESPNTNFGTNEGDDHPKISLVRQPDYPEWYLDTDLQLGTDNEGRDLFTFANKEPFDDFGIDGIPDTDDTGEDNGKFDWTDTDGDGQHDAGEASEPFADTGLDSTRPGWDDAAHGFGDGIYNMGNPTSEDVWVYLMRAVRYVMDRTHVDGLRLDAVKHVPDYFFGAFGDDDSSANYCGEAQMQFNLTHGFSDWNNHRDSLFDTEKPRDDAMMFGEHLGSPPGFGGYISAGMRLLDAPLRTYLGGGFDPGVLGNPSASLSGLDQPGFGGDPNFNQYTGVMFAQSHDNDPNAHRELQLAYYFTRAGLPSVYTDGNYQSETLGESGGAFPRHANTAFLGQFGDFRIPNAVYLHNHFARGIQVGKWADSDIVAFERQDYREGTIDPAVATTMFFIMNDNLSAGEYREISTSFRPGDYLWQYAAGGGGFYYTVSGDQKIKVITPPGGYFAFSWRSPESSDLWAGGNVVQIYQDGEEAETMTYERHDGPDGDPGFNPYGVTDTNSEDFAYTWTVPRVTSGNNLRFVVRVDGSAINTLVRLDGGIDINSQMGEGPQSGDLRDHPPGIFPTSGIDTFLGYEQAGFVHRQHAERFAATVTGARDIIGSQGAETYLATIGSSGFSTNEGGGTYSALDTAAFVYHDPNAMTDEGNLQFDPPPASASGSVVTNWVKIGDPCDVDRVFVYYTTDGSYPEGAGGEGRGSTKAVEMNFDHPDSGDGFDWWKGEIPALPGSTDLRYKIGAFQQQGYGGCGTGYGAVYPINQFNVDKKKQMMGVWEITNFNAQTISYRYHFDYGPWKTGLDDGFHIVQGRAFLERSVGEASIFNTFPQTFYLDLETPQGEIKFPQEGETLVSQEYGAVLRTDPTATEVFFHVNDNDPGNDDAATGDVNGNGLDSNGVPAWASAYSVTPSLDIHSDYPDEWRFTYRNVPTNGPASVVVRLFELSSTTNNDHFTTLSNNVVAAGPDQSVFVAYPANDRDVVSTDYVMKVYFSKSLVTGPLTDPGALTNSFLIKINGVAQGQDNYKITYDIFDGSYPPGDWHELAFRFPNLYNGNPNFDHLVEVRHTTPGSVVLQASRIVRAQAVDSGPMVSITEPTEFDSDGKPTVIELPDATNAVPEDREFTIRVETDLDAQHVWLQFATNGFKKGYFFPLPSIETKLAGAFTATQGTNTVIASKTNLSGTVDVVFSNRTITGTGTDFEGELRVGNAICIDTNVTLVITQIVSGTDLKINVPYPGATASGLIAAIQPQLLSEVSTSDTIKIDTNLLEVSQVQSDTNATTTTPYPGPTGSGLMAFRIDGNPAVVGSSKFWDFRWTNIVEGTYRFTAYVNTNSPDQTITNGSDTRTVSVIFLQLVDNDDSDGDDDDDGILDVEEQNSFNLPATNPETWTNWEVNAWLKFGKSDFLSPDSDRDGLPDGLEIGLRDKELRPDSDTGADTDGNGEKNFINDLDPPFYNTVPDNGCGQQPGPQWCVDDSPSPFNFSGSRTAQLGGSTTDPLNPDSDYDGIQDGIEDANHNGWVDGDGDSLPGNFDDPSARASWPDGILQISETWLETNPNDSDTDDDGASDGFGEDLDFDGVIAGDTNFDRIYDVGEFWTETDPLTPDTDGDGLPDGWEAQYNLDALDNGTNSLRTGGAGNAENGAEGNPDGDVLVVGIATQQYVNLLEFQNGTNPRFFDSGEPPVPGNLVVGPGEELGTAGGVTYFQEFMDWDADDCIQLDEYEGDGFNNQQGDIFPGYDGFDESRDITAFYARDGGPSGLGGDDKFYIRLDFFDLKPFAEEANLDIYVVIDTGQTGSGERVLPDDVDTLTDMRWELVVVSYAGNMGTVYIDRNTSQNTVDFGDDLFGFGGVASESDKFLGSYYNSELDSMELAIDRSVLTDLGYLGNLDNLNFQVFTTRDGTCNTCNGGSAGAGDRGGESDIRDTIFDDYLAEDNYFAKQGIQPILHSWIPGNFTCGQAKFASVVHGNQAIQAGSTIQDLVDDGNGAGYHRALDVHELFNVPLGLHVTPTLASALEWAAVDPAYPGELFRDGPALNHRVAGLVDTNIVDLFGSTFSDHILPYFTFDFNHDNADLARSFLNEIYDTTIDTNRAVFWTPERVADDDVFRKILDMGYTSTLIDQELHMRKWFGRETALGNDGYRINRIHGVNCFLINDLAVSFRFDNADNGLGYPLRRLVSRKARNGEQQQVITILSNWEDFGVNSQADAYDRNIRWLANHQWIRLVTHEQILNGDVGGAWFVIDRGDATNAENKVAHDFIHHSSEENYDNWYLGSGQEEGLSSKTFDIRPDVAMSNSYGMLYFGGVISQAWDDVNSVMDTNLARLARGTLHASTFETAFHGEDNFNLSKFSIGTYIYPDTSFDSLADFSKQAQAQTRTASVYEHVDEWADQAWQGWYDNLVVVTNLDVDLDGEDEYVLHNDRLYAVFEALGGRMVGAWVRDILSHETYQASGNLLSFATSETEEEGAQNIDGDNLVAFRTSGFKDWFSTKGAGTNYVNNLYAAVAVPNGWQFTSSDNHVAKTITLAVKAWKLEADYQLDSSDVLFVRHGLSPNLDNLLTHGQETLGSETHGGGVMTLANTSYVETVTVTLAYDDGSHDALFNQSAVDLPNLGVDYFTRNMRNQAQTHQVEVFGTNSFSFSLGFKAEPSDWDADGMPNTYEDEEGFDANNPADGADDDDDDGVSNTDEYIGNTDPKAGSGENDFPKVAGLTTTNGPDGVVVSFPTKTLRTYWVYYSNHEIDDPVWVLATSNGISGTGSVESWVDDGTATSPHPSDQTNRTYRVDTSLPP